MNDSTKTYSEGLRDAWDAAFRISLMTNEEKFRVFGISPRDNIFENYSASHIIEQFGMYDAANKGMITKHMLERYMYNHGICHPDLDESVPGCLVLDIVNDLLSDLIELGTVNEVLKQMKRRGTVNE